MSAFRQFLPFLICVLAFIAPWPPVADVVLFGSEMSPYELAKRHGEVTVYLHQPYVY